MPHDLYDWLGRIKAVEREYKSMRLASNRLLDEAHRDPTILTDDVGFRDIENALKCLEVTYIIRLFAEFETALRLSWPTARRTDPPSRTRDLIDGIAANRRIPDDERTNAHAVREYRNFLVHEGEEEAAPISISESRKHLCLFIKFLPSNW